MQSLKILQVCTRFAPYIGGTETVALEISRELAARGHAVTVVCADEPKVGDGVIEGIRVIRLPYQFKVANTNISLGLLPSLLREDFDVFHGHLPHPYFADLAALASRLKKRSFFLTYHNDTSGASPLASLLASVHNTLFLPFILNSAETVFVSSDAYAARSRWLGKHKEKLTINLLGVDTTRFFRDQAIEKLPKSIFFLSVLDEFHRYKGLDLLLEAFMVLKQGIPELRLFVGGEGALRKEYEQFCFDKGIGDAVSFLGRLSDRDVFTWYNKAELFVLPTLQNSQEGFGLVPLEAMACGCKVVVSDVPAIAADLPDESVFKAGDVNGCVSALEFALDRPQQTEPGLFEKYSWKRHVDVLVEEYGKAVGV